MEFDLATLAEGFTRFWQDNSDAVIAGSGLFLLVLLALTTRAFVRSPNKAQAMDRISSILVLAWTSEGMWEVVTAKDKLNLPVELAVVMFFFAETMILSAAMDAEKYRKKHGHPGPYARLVWLLTLLFMLVVFVGADTLVEHVFRLVVPLAAVTKWSTRLGVEWDSDTDELKAKRAEYLADREATWVYTPKSLLIRAGLMKPGETTTTAAQREHKIHRMVQLADSIATMANWRRGWARRRFRKLARTLTQDMLDEVQERLAITARALSILEGGSTASQAPVDLAPVKAEERAEPETAPASAQVEHPVERSDRSVEQIEEQAQELNRSTEQPVEQKPEPWAEFVREHEPELARDGGVEQPTIAVPAIAAPRRSTLGADSASTPGVVRAVATVPTGPSGRSLFVAAVAAQLRDGDLRILSAASRTRNAAGYDAAATVDGELTGGTVRKYVAHFRELIGLGVDVQGGEEHRVAALEQFAAPVEQLVEQNRSTVAQESAAR